MNIIISKQILKVKDYLCLELQKRRVPRLINFPPWELGVPPDFAEKHGRNSEEIPT